MNEMARFGCIGFIFVLGILYFIIADDFKPAAWYIGIGAILAAVVFILCAGTARIRAETEQGKRSWRSYLTAGIIGSILAGSLAFTLVVMGLLREYQTFSYPQAVQACYADWSEGCSEDAEGHAAGVLLFVLPAGFLAGLFVGSGYWFMRSLRQADSNPPTPSSGDDK